MENLESITCAHTALGSTERKAHRYTDSRREIDVRFARAKLSIAMLGLVWHESVRYSVLYELRYFECAAGTV